MRKRQYKRVTANIFFSLNLSKSHTKWKHLKMNQKFVDIHPLKTQSVKFFQRSVNIYFF